MRDLVQKLSFVVVAVALLTGSAVYGGLNEGATFTFDLDPAEGDQGDTELSGVGPGDTVGMQIFVQGAAALGGGVQIDLALDSEVFDVPATVAGLPSSFGGSLLEGSIALGLANDDGVGVAASFLPVRADDSAPSGDGLLATLALSVRGDIGSVSEASVGVSLIKLRSANSVDDFLNAGSVTINPSIVLPDEPMLTAVGESDLSRGLSLVGDGDVADGSRGEASLSVQFTDATGAATGGQAITWTISNNGGETAYLVSPAEVAIEAGASASIEATTDGSGSASGIFDAEGSSQSAGTSISVTATTTANNSDGESRELAAEFSVTWDVTVAAELASFTSEITIANDVVLHWSVPSQTNNLGWEVFRSVDRLVFEQVGDLIEGDGTTDEFKLYKFDDANTPQVDVLYYYLNQVDLDGTTTRSQIIEVGLGATAVLQDLLPETNELSQNFPNPFNPETTISFDLREAATVSLKIYDITGQLVRTLVQDRALSAGHYTQVWDGLNANGIKVGSGLYMYQLQAGDFIAQKKMTLLQ
ncbi:MAG: T9SS type A sorting domain-containing protein [Candidatus Latescibacteria bacterium]|nr:T9SS type A sorting domain-containing protein [Candidatus Latescibacterota bacterium]